MLEVRVLAIGFKIFNTHPVGNENIEFDTNLSFPQVVSGSHKYRAKVNLPEYAPTHSDCLTYLYPKLKSNIPAVKLSGLKWTFGIYGAVRNHHWKTQSIK